MIDSTIIVGLFSFAASVIGTFGGILVSSKLTNYRLEQLEDKVQQHNKLIERMYKVEDSAKSAHHRIDELREELNHV
ncbi:MAG: hypothetical protein IKW06_02230 [Clostridia bacterium]|nr:hypothetical protein [Clostridia bacterium]